METSRKSYNTLTLKKLNFIQFDYLSALFSAVIFWDIYFWVWKAKFFGMIMSKEQVHYY